jgi:hypothetical protein
MSEIHDRKHGAMTDHATLLESMTEAWWDRHANVPWADFMRDHPDKKAFYLESMDAALSVLNAHSSAIQRRGPNPYATSRPGEY